jgi:arylsulfatase A-like enzyme
MSRSSLWFPIVALGAVLLGGLAIGCDSGPPGRFVVLVVTDSVRRDALGCYGRAGNPSPAIDALAYDGVRFDRAVAASSWTLPALASILTATPPTAHGAGLVGDALAPVRAGVVTAAEAMQAAGYRTAAFSNAAFVRPGLGVERGFEVFDHSAARRADATVAAALDYARDHRGEDCFLLVDLFDAHLDYDPPGEFANRYTNGRNQPPRPLSAQDCTGLEGADGTPAPVDLDYVRAVYQGEVAFVDRQIFALMQELKALGVFDRAFVIVAGDHGEEFWDHGGFGHGHTLHEELVAVPLVIKFPTELHASTQAVRWQVGMIDVLPTVFDYLAVSAPASFTGRSLLPYVRAEPEGHRSVLSQGLLFGKRRVSWRTASHVYIHDLESGPEAVGELYDLRADPREHNDIAGSEPALAATLRDECIDRFYELIDDTGTSARETVEMTPEEAGCVAELESVQ